VDDHIRVVDHPRVVGGGEDQGAGACGGLQNRKNLLYVVVVLVSGRLVEDGYGGIQDECAGQGCPLLLPQ
jgi:hypothetical protein